ncbi:MAG: hypothetical protein GVY10_00520 [Verrucomicrobia bacterium]|nr:hypothetical protein [Verrucomicrobiota bacterium]
MDSPDPATARGLDRYIAVLADLGERAERHFCRQEWADLRNLQSLSLEAADAAMAAPPPASPSTDEWLRAHAAACRILGGEPPEGRLRIPAGARQRQPSPLPSRILTKGVRKAACAFAAEKGLSLPAGFEVFPQVFFRNRRAYVITRSAAAEKERLLVLAVTQDEEGPVLDAVLTTEEEITPVFEFSRAMLIPRHGNDLSFLPVLEKMLPGKPRWQLLLNTGYILLGRALLLEELRQHMRNSRESMEVAPGTPGMVMVVFHLPTFPVVFKIIKDTPDPPKSVGRREVLRKYRLVAEHDRVGRLADSHLFENLPFPVEAFAPELLGLLKERCAASLTIAGDMVFFREVLVERKMVPLDLVLEEATSGEAALLDEYAAAVEDLAWANIFPGDLLLKNFGVTRLGRVVFYDYDEVELLTSCFFRRLPDEDGEITSIGPSDVFPEEWPRFLFRREETRKYFMDTHAEIFDPAFWNRCRSLYARGGFIDLFPYKSQRG